MIEHMKPLSRLNSPDVNNNRMRLDRMRYLYGYSEPNYPVPAIRKFNGTNRTDSKINALNHGAWRWYWYLSGFNYGR